MKGAHSIVQRLVLLAISKSDCSMSCSLRTHIQDWNPGCVMLLIDPLVVDKHTAIHTGTPTASKDLVYNRLQVINFVCKLDGHLLEVKG